MRHTLRAFRFAVCAASALAFVPRPAGAEGEIVRLTRHGRTGDTFLYRFVRHTKSEILFSETQDARDRDETLTRTVTMKQRGASKDGSLLLEIRAGSGKRDLTVQGEQKHTPLPPLAALYTLTPDQTAWDGETPAGIRQHETAFQDCRRCAACRTQRNL